jgi:hypothetical protein
MDELKPLPFLPADFFDKAAAELSDQRGAAGGSGKPMAEPLEGEWVTEDSLDTLYRVEELFLMLTHGVVLRIGEQSRARVNSKAIAALRALYAEHGRLFEPTSNTVPFSRESIEALMWVKGQPNILDQAALNSDRPN